MIEPSLSAWTWNVLFHIFSVCLEHVMGWESIGWHIMLLWRPLRILPWELVRPPGVLASAGTPACTTETLWACERFKTVGPSTSKPLVRQNSWYADSLGGCITGFDLCMASGFVKNIKSRKYQLHPQDATSLNGKRTIHCLSNKPAERLQKQREFPNFQCEMVVAGFSW